MPIQFNKPKISLLTLKEEALALTYNSNFYSKTSDLLKELQNHFIGIMMPGVTESEKNQAFPIFVRIESFQKEFDRLLASPGTLVPEAFQTLKEKLVHIIQDLLTFINSNNIDDKSIGDIKINWK